MAKKKDITGQQFGRLIVIGESKKKNDGKNKCPFWFCQCSCGNLVCVRTDHLKSGGVVSCGCFEFEQNTILKDNIESNYRQTRRADGKTVPRHCLIIEQALGYELEKHEEVHHINGDGADNRLENLEVLDLLTHARLHKGKLTQNEANEIKKECLSKSNAVIGQEYGVHRRTISDIRNGKTWN